jgi:ankyrin repeat protein
MMSVTILATFGCNINFMQYTPGCISSLTCCFYYTGYFMASLTPEQHQWFSLIAAGKTPNASFRQITSHINMLHPQTGLSALMMSVCNDQPKLIGWLLEQNADPMVTSRQRQWTALHFAVDGGNPKIADMLLKSRVGTGTAMVDKADALGRTPLHYCIIADNPSLTPKIRETLIARLLAENADCERKDEEGATALHYCAIYGRIHESNQLLVHGANPNARSHECELSPCHIAALEGHEDMALAMLMHGADPLAATAQGWSLKSRFPDLCAVAMKNINLVKNAAEMHNRLAGRA